VRRAVALYRRVLAVEPGNRELHETLAPLLARCGQRFDAWLSFKLAAREYRRQGRREQALSIYREAAELLPHQLGVWLEIAKLEREKGRSAEALEALRSGRRYFRGRRQRPLAIHILRRARELDPWNADIVVDLARQLTRARRVAEARDLLADLARRCPAPQLRRVRAAQVYSAPTPRHAWLWLVAALSRQRAIDPQTGTVTSQLIPSR